MPPEKRMHFYSNAGSGLDQAEPNGVAHETRGFMDIQFFHDPGPMRIGRFHAYIEYGCDLLGGITFGYQL